MDPPTHTWSVVGQGDFDLDGTPDILWRNASSGDVRIQYMSGGVVAQDLVVANAVPREWQLLGVGDFVGDGRSRMLWRNTVLGIVGFWTVAGRGGSIAWSQVAAPVPNGWQFVQVVDVNADRKSDIVWRYVDNTYGAWIMNGATITGWQPYTPVP